MLWMLYCGALFMSISVVGQVHLADSFESTVAQYSSLGAAEIGLACGNVLASMSGLQKFFAAGGSTVGLRTFWRLLFASGQYALLANQKNIFEDDIEMQKIYLQSLMMTHKKVEALQLLNVLEKRFSDNPELIFMSASYASEIGENLQALQTLTNFLTKDKSKRRFAQFIFLKARVEYSLGMYSSALETLQGSPEIFSRLVQAHALEGLTYEKMNNLPQAIDSYKLFLEKSGQSQGGICKHLMYLLFTSNRFDEAKEILQKQQQNTSEYFFDLALIEWKNNEKKAALAHVAKAISLDPSLFAAHLLELQLLVSEKKYTQIADVLSSWITSASDINDPIKAILLLYRAGMPTSLIEGVLTRALSTLPKQKQLLAALGDIYFSNNDFVNGCSCYEQIIPLIHDNRLKSSLLYAVSYGLFKSGKVETIPSLLEQAKRLSSDPQSHIDHFMSHLKTL